MAAKKYDMRTVQIVPMNKYRHLFVIAPASADVTSKKNHVKETFALRKMNDTDVQHLKVWREGNNICFEELAQNEAAPDRENKVVNEFNNDAGAIYIAYKPDDDNNVGTGYIIVGTGDFRNITTNPLNHRFWELPDANTPIVIENVENFKIKIHSKNPFQ